jgi:hypothetical protein
MVVPQQIQRGWYRHSPTEREERNQKEGSSLERVPGKQGEIPRPLGRKRRQRLLSPGLALRY